MRNGLASSSSCATTDAVLRPDVGNRSPQRSISLLRAPPRRGPRAAGRRGPARAPGPGPHALLRPRGALGAARAGAGRQGRRHADGEPVRTRRSPRPAGTAPPHRPAPGTGRPPRSGCPRFDGVRPAGPYRSAQCGHASQPRTRRTPRATAIVGGGPVGARGVPGTAELPPGGRGELEAAVVAVAGVGVPPAARLAVGDAPPRPGRRAAARGAGGGAAPCWAGASRTRAATAVSTYGIAPRQGAGRTARASHAVRPRSAPPPRRERVFRESVFRTNRRVTCTPGHPLSSLSR